MKVKEIVKLVFLVEIFRGLSVTIKHFFKKPITTQYPERRRTFSPRYRGLHELQRYADGSERCVACGLCAAVCPSQCIEVVPAEDENGRRYAKVWKVNIARCIFCGFCVEACPYYAIKLTDRHELDEYQKERLVYSKERLLASKGFGSPPPNLVKPLKGGGA
ncbi:MAG TPA: NADH-quinone oxidoreductase subunit NuoI [Proteobacteria bacterium]|nr:NADH-quinone oxidoreductase subunit NuoI [Pseudomonadota bacterium]